MKLNESIIKIRVELQNKKMNKSGKNKFAGFTYYELSDFLPELNKLMLENGVNDRFYIKDGYSYLELIKGDERESYSIPFTVYETPVNKNGVKSMQDIQYLGALNTYYKRYLYLNAFGITDGEVIDAIDNSQSNSHSEKPVNKLTDPMLKKINTLVTRKKEALAANNFDRDALKKHYKVESLKDLSFDAASGLITWLEGL